MDSEVRINKRTKEQITKNSTDIKKVKIEVSKGEKYESSRAQFVYGNYSKYYGYRNNGFHDIRLNIFDVHSELFNGKEILDIGCNNGLITFAVSQRFNIKNIIGLDIDSSLIKKANKMLLRYRKLPINHGIPNNVKFLHANYILRHDNLLDIEEERFDLVLCLSVTKWLHLNFGDEGIKQAFRRMYSQLRSGGKLILEAQRYESYKRRKNMTERILHNYKTMEFFPHDFTEYLLSDVGFVKVELMGVPEKCAVGFQRPIQVFHKK